MLRRYYLRVKRTEQIEKWIAEEQKNRANQEKLFWWLMSSYFELSFINTKISIKLLFQFGRDCLVGRGTFIQP